MCELTHGMAGERHGRGMGAAWARHTMCESAFNVTVRFVKRVYGCICLRPTSWFWRLFILNTHGS
jgi:hypothetical protein